MPPSRTAVPVLETPLGRDEVLPWLRKRPAELRAEEQEIVAALASRYRHPKDKIRKFVKSFMAK